MKKRDLCGIAGVFFILATGFLFFDGIKYRNNKGESCFTIIFGSGGKHAFFIWDKWEPCFVLIIAFIALVAALVISFICYKRTKSFVLPIVAAVCGVLASILFLCAVPLSLLANDLVADYYKRVFDLGIGFTLSGIFGLLSSLFIGVSLALEE